MHEGYLFFSLMWLGCWYFIFISNETAEIRRWGFIKLLLGICCAGLLIPVMFIQINLLFIVTALYAIVQWRNCSTIQLFKGVALSIWVTIALVCIRICSILYPIWFIINWIYVAAILLAILSISLLPASNRLNSVTLGIIMGETVYSGILILYGFPIKVIGSWESLDLLVLTSAIVVIYNKAQAFWAGRIPKRKMFPSPQIGIKGK